MKYTQDEVCPGTSMIGDWRRCPICNREVSVSNRSLRVPRHDLPYSMSIEYANQTYADYFNGRLR